MQGCHQNANRFANLNFCGGWHARKFCEFNDLDWEPTSKDDVCPPNEFFNNDNMSDFFIELFHVRGKPSIQQAHKWLNHVLAQNKRPPVNKMHHQHYASVLDVLRGMTKEDKWKSHKSKGAESFTKEVVRKIFEAQLVDPKTQELSLVRLRNKALAILMIGNGWHVKEVLRLRDDGVEDFPNYTDRDGKIRPKMVFRGQKAKEPVLTKNTVGCGCRGRHTVVNTNCFYNVLSWYKKKKEQSDAEFVEKKMCKMAQSQRDTHLNEDGTLETRRFFRSHPTKKDKFNYPHRNMGRGAINDVFEFWNVELGENGDKMVPGEKLTTNQARKTFATFGYRHTAHKTRAVLFHFPWEALMAVTHHSDPNQFVGEIISDRKYVCQSTWSDLEEESHIARTMNLWSQGHHRPTVGSSTRDALEMTSRQETLTRG